jgi:hypothetical protein
MLSLSKHGAGFFSSLLGGERITTGWLRRRTSTLSPPATQPSTVEVSCFSSRIVVIFMCATLK